MADKKPFCRAGLLPNSTTLVFNVSDDPDDQIHIRTVPDSVNSLETLAEAINKAVAARELKANCTGIREGMMDV